MTSTQKISATFVFASALLLTLGAYSEPKPATQPVPNPDQLMNSMLKGDKDKPKDLPPLNNKPTVDATAAKAVAPNAPAVKVMREGSFIVDRVGRLNKSADGSQWELSLEADGKNMQDPPLIILPNLNLAAMEQAINGASRDLKFRVTGVLTEYKGRNYILLEKVVVPPDQG